MPTHFQLLNFNPIIDAVVIGSNNLIILANYTHLIAWEFDKMKWQSKRLAWDGFEIIEVSTKSIIGKYFDVRTDNFELFEVDILTGNSKGGVEE